MEISRKQSVAMPLQLNDIVFANDWCALIVQVNVAGVDMTTQIPWHAWDTSTVENVVQNESMEEKRA